MIQFENANIQVILGMGIVGYGLTGTVWHWHHDNAFLLFYFILFYVSDFNHSYRNIFI